MSKLSRRKLIGGGAVVAGAVAMPNVARAQTVRWRMVTSWPKRLPGPGMSAERVAERIATLSGGRIQITVHAAGEIVPALETLDAVSSGTAEMAHTAAFYWQGKQPASAFFTTVPFGMTPGRAHRLDRRRRRAGAVGRALCAVRRQTVHGGQHRRLHGRLVSQRDRRCRSAEGHEDPFARPWRRSLSPARRSAADHVARRDHHRAAVGPGRRRGVRRARARTSRSVSIVWRRTTMGPASTSRTVPASASSSLKVWDALDAQQKAIVAHACAAEAAFALNEMERLNVEALAALTERNGVKLRTFPRGDDRSRARPCQGRHRRHRHQERDRAQDRRVLHRLPRARREVGERLGEGGARFARKL